MTSLVPAGNIRTQAPALHFITRHMQRRKFLHQSLGLAAVSVLAGPIPLLAGVQSPRLAGSRLKLALNAYSFHSSLSSGKMTLHDLVDYCATHAIDGVDPTGYYFPGYPAVPSDDYIYGLKRRAYINGVTINCVGVRSDFAATDAAVRRQHVALVKNWVDVASKLGGSVVRVFAGSRVPAGHSFEQVMEWMVPALQECASYGAQRGIIIGVQHHNDVLKTAAETIRVVDAVGSEWFKVILDVGSLRQGDPYAEIEKLVPYACTWQVKEKIYYGDKAVRIDLPRLKAIIDKVGFRGFLPIETLEPGDPKIVVTQFVEQVRKAMF